MCFIRFSMWWLRPYLCHLNKVIQVRHFVLSLSISVYSVLLHFTNQKKKMENPCSCFIPASSHCFEIISFHQRPDTMEKKHSGIESFLLFIDV